jgi:hypothetical protein
VVEVKLTDEKSASTAKQNRYRKWMNSQRESHKEAVLLTIDANPMTSEGDFRRRDWRKDVSTCAAWRAGS